MLRFLILENKLQFNQLNVHAPVIIQDAMLSWRMANSFATILMIHPFFQIYFKARITTTYFISYLLEIGRFPGFASSFTTMK